MCLYFALGPALDPEWEVHRKRQFNDGDTRIAGHRQFHVVLNSVYLLENSQIVFEEFMDAQYCLLILYFILGVFILF